MRDSIHVSKENYLKAILEAEAEGREVIPAVLAHWLEVSAPAVTMALKRLKRDGEVEVGADGIVRLTARGRETAYHTALRHHLVERMLSELFGMEWHQIHEEAERLEHAVSPAFEAKLREKLGEGGACPHGNAVLPERPAERKRRGETKLSEAQEGKRYTVTSLQERDPRLLLFLHKSGIGPGRTLRILSQNYDQTVEIELEPGPAASEGTSARRSGAKLSGSKGTSARRAKLDHPRLDLAGPDLPSPAPSSLVRDNHDRPILGRLAAEAVWLRPA
jgi:DtxR family Mn-dependent transcriptional regulator